MNSSLLLAFGQYRRFGVDDRLDRHSGAQPPSQCAAVEDDLHGDALHDLREVTRRVVGRQQSEFEPARRGKAVDMAGQRHARIAVDFDLDRLAAPHMRQLRLLEIGDDVGGAERNDGHELRPGLYVLADAERAGANRAVDRRRNRGIGEVELGLMLDRVSMVALCLGLRALRRKHLDLVLCGDQSGMGAVELRHFLTQRRIRLLGALHSAVAGLHEVLIADVFLSGECQRCLGGGDIGLLLIDDRILQHNLGVEVANRGFGGRDIGLRLIEGGSEIPIVDAGEELSCLDRLVVLDEHVGDVPRHLRSDRCVVGFDVGVIGRFEKPADRPILVAVSCRDGDAGEQRQTRDRALQHRAGGQQAGIGSGRSECHCVFLLLKALHALCLTLRRCAVRRDVIMR
jgi:hypothetical protein